MLALEVLVVERAPVDRLAARAVALGEVTTLSVVTARRTCAVGKNVEEERRRKEREKRRTWIMKPLMMRWKHEPRKWRGLPESLLMPFSPVHSARKFSAVLGVTSV